MLDANTPAVFANTLGSQTIPNTTWTTVNLGTEGLDAQNNFANNGGAVDCQYYAMPVFNNVTFKNNFAQIVPNTSPQGPSGAGGAVIISSGDAYPVFNYCTFISYN